MRKVLSQWSAVTNGCAFGLIVSTVAVPALARATSLAAGFYSQTATVVSNNGNANCASAGLAVGTANNGTIDFPGNGKTGLVQYLPQAGSEYLCNGFSAIPKTGLSNYSSGAICSIYNASGNEGSEGVTFTFTMTVASANSAAGSYVVAIPDSGSVGAGCTATVNATLVYSGKSK